jgi:hypothetical protein
MVWTLALVCGSAMAEPIAPESFETGFGSWVKDSSAVDTLRLGPSIVRVSPQAHSGQWGVEFLAQTSDRSGAFWLERKLTIDPGTYEVTLSFWMWSPSQTTGNTWDVASVIGTSDPEVQGDLATIGRTGAVAGWQFYSLRKALTVDQGRAMWLAFGLGMTAALDGKFEFDDVTIDVVRRPCRPDYDHSGSVTVQDIFAFLTVWFAGSAGADYNGVGGVNTQDIFDFLSGWFAGC